MRSSTDQPEGCLGLGLGGLLGGLLGGGFLGGGFLGGLLGHGWLS